MQVTINPNGRLTFPRDLIYPDPTIYYVAGVDLLYSKESEEIAFEIYRIPLNSTDYRSDKIKQLGTTLTIKPDNSINLKPYFKKINFFKLPTHHRNASYEAYVIDNYIIVKLNPINPKTNIPANFDKLEIERIRQPNEISISTCGLLSLPPTQLAQMLCEDYQDPDIDQAARALLRSRSTTRKCSITFDQDTKTFHIHLTKDGDRSIKQDATISLQTMLAQNGLEIPKRLFLPYHISGNTLSFCLTDKDPINERHNLRQVRRLLGVTY